MGIKVGIAVVILFTGMLYCWSLYESESENDHPERYQVLVTDDVSAVEFLERYEIVEKCGNSYIVEERNE